MAAPEWFRNNTWNNTIETHFYEKLRRARRKAQYIRIQASYLAESHPKIALDLLEKYFALGDHFDDAQAYLDQARAYLAQKNKQQAIAALQNALRREYAFPNLITTAWREYVIFVATEREVELYDHALSVLTKYKPQIVFPIDTFAWFAAFALISDSLGDREKAKDAADKALHWSEVQHSGFRYHPHVGLVSTQYEAIKETLRQLC